jgi:D-alanyl-D-alanine carboxypeptidase (penicillin-binding protein 5/6)
MIKRKKIKAVLLALGIAASTILPMPVLAAEEASPGTIATNAISGWPQGPEITSEAAVVMDEKTNTILYSKNMDSALYPSAAVKIMTCLVALENSALTDNVTMTATGVAGAVDGGANIAAQADEVFTMEQCLYAIMLASANDISLQVAEHIGGSLDGFVEKMNAKATELGCTNTLFTNPTGLSDENQHTTAHDMALIMKAAMSNETFCTIAGATTYTIPATNMSGGERVLSNNFSMMTPASPLFYDGCLGGKEGFTQASGSTLVCGAEKNGLRLVCVILKGSSGDVTESEAGTLLDYGFNNFQTLSLGQNDFSVLSGGDLIVPNGTTEASITSSEAADASGQLIRTYSFNGVPVGTAVVEAVETANDTAVADGEAHLQEAKEFGESKSYLPYVAIGGIGLAILIFLIYRIVKIIRA